MGLVPAQIKGEGGWSLAGGGTAVTCNACTGWSSLNVVRAKTYTPCAVCGLQLCCCTLAHLDWLLIWLLVEQEDCNWQQPCSQYVRQGCTAAPCPGRLPRSVGQALFQR